MSQNPDLLSYTKECVKRIAADFKKPDDDFVPVLLIKMHNDEMTVLELHGDMNSQQEKNKIAKFMLAACACARAKEVAFVSSAWLGKYDGMTTENWHEIEQRDDFVMPRDNPDRIEVVNIMHTGPSGDMLSSCEITRHEEKGEPPTLAADWDDMGGEGATLGGRFGDAIHDGVKLGEHLASDVTPAAVTQYMDEMIAGGKFEELIQGFMRGMDAANRTREQK